MRIVVSSVFVDDQDKALDFYTNMLGFVKKTEIPMGAARWLTVVAPSDPDGTELLLERDSHPAVGPFQKRAAARRNRFTSFGVDDVMPSTNVCAPWGWPSRSRQWRWAQ